MAVHIYTHLRVINIYTHVNIKIHAQLKNTIYIDKFERHTYIHTYIHTFERTYVHTFIRTHLIKHNYIYTFEKYKNTHI